MPVKMANFFNLPSDKNVILLKRLRIVDGKLLCLSIAYLMPEIFYWTTLEDMEHESLYDLLENKYDFKLGNATQEFEGNPHHSFGWRRHPLHFFFIGIKIPVVFLLISVVA